MSDTSKPERRALAYRLNEEDLLNLFSLFAGGFPDVVRVPELHLPEGATVSHAYHDREARQFVIVALHPSFPLWADGDRPERAEASRGKLVYDVHSVPVEKGENGPRIMRQKYLIEEVERLRAVFNHDIRQDSPAIDAAYRQGVAQERERCAAVAMKEHQDMTAAGEAIGQSFDYYDRMRASAAAARRIGDLIRGGGAA